MYMQFACFLFVIKYCIVIQLFNEEKKFFIKEIAIIYYKIFKKLLQY